MKIFYPTDHHRIEICLNSGLIKGMEVCYVDTKNDLVPQRILQILQEYILDNFKFKRKIQF